MFISKITMLTIGVIKLKIKVKANVPVKPKFCPKIGETYDVLRLFESYSRKKVFYIRVNGAVVGVCEKDCQVIR